MKWHPLCQASLGSPDDLPGLKLNELLMQIRRTSPSPPPGAVIGGYWWAVWKQGPELKRNTFRQFNCLTSKTWKYKAVSFESSCGPGGKWTQAQRQVPWVPVPALQVTSCVTQAKAQLPHVSLAGSVSSVKWKWIQLWRLTLFHGDCKGALTPPQGGGGAEGGFQGPLLLLPVPLHYCLLGIVSLSLLCCSKNSANLFLIF